MTCIYDTFSVTIFMLKHSQCMCSNRRTQSSQGIYPRGGLHNTDILKPVIFLRLNNKAERFCKIPSATATKMVQQNLLVQASPAITLIHLLILTKAESACHSATDSLSMSTCFPSFPPEAYVFITPEILRLLHFVAGYTSLFGKNLEAAGSEHSRASLSCHTCELLRGIVARLPSPWPPM